MEKKTTKAEWHKAFIKASRDYSKQIRINTDLRFEISEKIEKVCKFIEEKESKDSNGRVISDFSKLCFILEDLDKIQKSLNVKKENISPPKAKAMGIRNAKFI